MSLGLGCTWNDLGALSQLLSGEAWTAVFPPSSPGHTAPTGTLSTGLISTKSNNLDREMQARYEIVVEARDAQGLQGESGTATVLVTLQDINDNFPIFTQSKPLPWGPGEGRGWDTPGTELGVPLPLPPPQGGPKAQGSHFGEEGGSAPHP